MANEVKALITLEHKKCGTCRYYESGSMSKGYCHLLSRSGEQAEAVINGAAAYDNFWVTEQFYCAKHEDS